MKKPAKKRGRPSPLADLARALRVSRNAIDAWRTRFANTPTPTPPLANVAAWREFITTHGLGVVGNRVSPRRESLLEQINERKLRLADLEIARKEGRVVLRTDMDALHHAIFTRQMAVLSAALISEFPGKVVGRTVAEIRVYGTQLRDRLCDILSQDIAHWQWTSDDTKL